MQRNCVASDHAVRFVAVFDSRKRKIRGLWKRGDRYYGQMRMEVDGGQTKPKRIALNAITLDQARAELEKARTENRAGKQVMIGADGAAKNARHRRVNFSSELASLLHEMREGRQPDNSFPFPSAQRRSKDIPGRSLRESFRLARRAAGLPWVGFHDLRNFFEVCEHSQELQCRKGRSSPRTAARLATMGSHRGRDPAG
jgi:integrase